jgi:GNAT superfamily N-acetyltransferase
MSVMLRRLVEADLPAAELIIRRAFGRFFGVDALEFRKGADVIGPRWRAWPEASLGIERDGALVAVASMMRWGSVCILGPVTVDPEHWDKGLARLLMPALVQKIDEGRFAFAGLFTHPQSPKHIRLYEAFGFEMQHVTAVMAKPVDAPAATCDATRFSRLDPSERKAVLASIRELTGSVFPALELGGEIEIVADLKIGETLVLGAADRPEALAICHFGPRSEASEGQLYVKFAAVGARKDAETHFAALLEACEQLAAELGARRIVAGTNRARARAYRMMRAGGYRTVMNGVAMMRPDSVGYNTDERLVADDWR